MPTTNTSYYKKVRRDGKWVTIDTRTGKVVTREKRRTDYKEDLKSTDKRRSTKYKKPIANFIKKLGNRLVYSDETDNKGKQLTVRQSNKRYEKEQKATNAGENNQSEWGPKGQPTASKQMKKYKPKNVDKVKVNKDESSSSSSSSSSPNTESKEQFLKRTRNSPAAKSGAFTDEERWKQRQKHLKWKASRKKK
jgi:hypothetical protein|tara:strand:+ start:88 stop:666 length:579 start_codon:yes stop_codon:yes gene_type:complete